uniref:Uncharacterized protein n=1 Tax=Magallana gigas TaxID=29159 RepID=A0A8W8MQT2_MAGGI
MHPCVSLFLLCNIAYVRAIQCARTQDEWNKASASLKCQEPTYYHCLRDENGIMTQKCLERVWIQNGMCPEFNSRVDRIDVFQCQSDKNVCPNTIFWSNAVYIYPICYDKTIPTTTINSSAILLTSTETQVPENATSSGKKNNKNPDVGLIVAIAISIVIVIIFIIVARFMCLRKKKRKEKKKENGNENSLSFNKTSEGEILDGIATNVTARGSESDQRSETNEEEKLLENTNKNVSPRSNEIRQTEQISMIKEQENLIDKPPKKEIPGHSQPNHSDFKRENTDKLIGDLTMKLKDEVYGINILIFVMRTAPVLNKNTVKNVALKELKVEVDMENSFQIWAGNKTKESYVFQDWIPSDGKYNENYLRETQLEILQAVERNNTKFVFMIPFTIWAQHAILNDMGSWDICVQKTI